MKQQKLFNRSLFTPVQFLTIAYLIIKKKNNKTIFTCFLFFFFLNKCAILTVNVVSNNRLYCKIYNVAFDS